MRAFVRCMLMTVMRSTPSNNKLPHWAQAVLIVICAGLAIMIVTDPARNVPGVSVADWLQRLGHIVGIDQRRDEVLLAPDPHVLAGARPLIDFGGIQFLGCDRAVRGSTLELVTYWQVNDTAPYQIDLWLVLPDSSTREVTHALDAATLFTPLPESFYAADRHGEVWLRVVDVDQHPVAAHASLRPTNSSGWTRICN